MARWSYEQMKEMQAKLSSLALERSEVAPQNPRDHLTRNGFKLLDGQYDLDSVTYWETKKRFAVLFDGADGSRWKPTIAYYLKKKG